MRQPKNKVASPKKVFSQPSRPHSDRESVPGVRGQRRWPRTGSEKPQTLAVRVRRRRAATAQHPPASSTVTEGSGTAVIETPTEP